MFFKNIYFLRLSRAYPLYLLCYNSFMKSLKKTKIVATIGPASASVEILSKLAEKGMNIARINFSHGERESLIKIAENIKKAEKKTGKIIGLLQDLQGPKIRTGDFKNGNITLKVGSKVEITSKYILGTEKKFTINVKPLFQDTKIGDRIILNDGYQELEIISKKIKEKTIIAKVISGGKIKDRRGASFPDSNLSFSSLTKKDKEDIDWFATKYKPDFIAFSFVKTAKDVKELKNILKKKKLNPMIIAKMETATGMRNFDEILEEVDGIMVARGDLGVEVPAEEVPFLQKEMIKKCNAVAKPVIVATQMLESMIENPVPTRAEVSDIANAILDGADAIMLSAETSVGKHPLKVVDVMRKVSREVEEELDYKNFISRRTDVLGERDHELYKVIPRYAVKTASDINAKAISVFTETGFTAGNIARFRSVHPVFVFSPNEDVLRKTAIYYGLFPAENKITTTILNAENIVKDFLLKKKFLKKNEKFVIVAGMPFRQPGNTNIIYVSE